MWLLILDQPPVDQLSVRPPPHLLMGVERPQGLLKLRQPVERYPRKVMVLEVIVGIEEHEVPEPAPAHQRAPLRRIGRIDVVMLAETVQREGDREDEEHRNDAGAERRVEP